MAVVTVDTDCSLELLDHRFPCCTSLLSLHDEARFGAQLGCEEWDQAASWRMPELTLVVRARPCPSTEYPSTCTLATPYAGGSVLE
jgi:hypothetical protein